VPALPVTVNTAGVLRNEIHNNGWNWDLYNDLFDDPYYGPGQNGLSISSGGAITVLNVNASGNDGGLMLRNEFASAARTVVVTNADLFRNNRAGMWLVSRGAVTLTNVGASENGYDGGIHVENAFCYYDGLLGNWVCPTPTPVTMTNIRAENNGSTGLYVYSLGLVRLTTATVNNNQGGGIFMENGCIRDGDWICPTTANGITLTGVTANDNWGTGLEAYSRGIIALATVTTNNNWTGGMRLNNRDYYDPNNTAAGITLSNVQAHSNNGAGIWARTNGTLGMANIRANNNVVRDGDIFAGQTVQDYVNEYKSGDHSDHWWFEATAGNGYELILNVSNLSGLNQMDFDPWMQLINPDDPDGWDNPLFTIKSGDAGCVFNDSCTFTFHPDDYGFSDTKWFVVRVGSDYGDTSNTMGDGFYRLSLNDPNPNDDPVLYWVNGLDFIAGGGATMTGVNSFHGNSLSGLKGSSNGTISLTSVGAFDNGTEGIYVDNCIDTGSGCTGTGNILLAGSNITGINGWEGLVIKTNGTVGVFNLEAAYNGYRANADGIWISAHGDGKAVTLTNINAQQNCWNGITLDVYGITTFNAVHAWQNGNWGTQEGSGVHMDSHGYAINLINFCWFMDNAKSGFAFNNSLAPIVTAINAVFWGNGGDDYWPYL